VVNHQQHLRATLNQDGAAILDLKAGRISTLNSSGAYVWQALGRGEEIDTISEGLAQQTGEPVDAVMACPVICTSEIVSVARKVS